MKKKMRKLGRVKKQKQKQIQKRKEKNVAIGIQK